jgi:hypothetical protein
MKVSSWILLRMRHISHKGVKKIKTRILCPILFSQKLCRNVEKYGRARQTTDENMIWRMCFACRITKVTNSHSEYVILVAFPWQQWLCERATMLSYTYITCLVISYILSSVALSFYISLFLLLFICTCVLLFFSFLSFPFSCSFSSVTLPFLSSQNIRHCRSWSNISHWI